MKSPWAQLTVALVTICSGAAFLAQADGQNVAPDLCAVSAWPTYVAGQKAYYRVYPTADREGQQWLDAHKRRGEELIYVFYALAAAALSAALISAKAGSLGVRRGGGRYVNVAVMCTRLAHCRWSTRRRAWQFDRTETSGSMEMPLFVARGVSSWNRLSRAFWVAQRPFSISHKSERRP